MEAEWLFNVMHGEPFAPPEKPEELPDPEWGYLKIVRVIITGTPR
jgi:hypothetical protein